MKKYITIVLILFFSNGGFSQPSVRFKKFYDLPPHFASNSYDVTTIDSGYIVSGFTTDTIAGISYNKLTLMGVDSAGNLLWVKKYGNSNFQYSTRFSTKWLLKQGNSLYLTCPVVKTSNKTNSVLIKFNLIGDTLWQKEFADTQNSLVTIGINRVKNDFILTGYVGDNASQSMLLMKIDSTGNEIWRKKINTNNFSIEGRGVVYDTLTRKYVIVGIHSPPPNSSTRSIVIVTDSTGNKLNQYSYSSSFGGGLINIVVSYDNNFIACGSNSTGVQLGSFVKVKRQLVKFNISGNVLWSKEYGAPSILNEYAILKELPNHNIIASGQYDTLMNAGLGLNSNFLIQQTNQNGDSIWSRTIGLVIGSSNQNVLNSMDRTKDGGYVLTGFFIGAPAPNKFCLVKLDSLGCDSSGCQFLGINEQKKSFSELIVYPNPTQSKITLKFEVSETKNILLEIKNVLGQTVKTIDRRGFSSGKNKLEIDISECPSGLYFVQLQSENKIWSSKLFNVIH